MEIVSVMFLGLWLLLLVAAILIAFAIGFLLFYALWCGVLICIKPKRWPQWALLGLPVYLLLFTTLLVGGSWQAYSYITSPRTAFVNEFGFAPPKQVTNLRSTMWCFGDSGYAYLNFNATPKVIHRIASQGLTRSTAAATRSNVDFVDKPNWWQPPTAKSTNLITYIGHNHQHGFATEDQLLIFDQAGGRVWWYSDGID